MQTLSIEFLGSVKVSTGAEESVWVTGHVTDKAYDNFTKDLVRKLDAATLTTDGMMSLHRYLEAVGYMRFHQELKSMGLALIRSPGDISNLTDSP